MKAMMSTAPGGPDSLSLMERPTPQAGPGQIVVAVKAAGVNFPDTLIIRDLYQFRPERPFAPGGEVAGVVETVGDGVTALKPGDRVLAMTLSGGYATHLLVDARAAVKIPDAMPFDEAAGFMMTYGTSHYALKDRARLASGETLFILGAAGGVGAAAIELPDAFTDGGQKFGGGCARALGKAFGQPRAQFVEELGRKAHGRFAVGFADPTIDETSPGT